MWNHTTQKRDIERVKKNVFKPRIKSLKCNIRNHDDES